jgi:hypothetical protein
MILLVFFISFTFFDFSFALNCTTTVSSTNNHTIETCVLSWNDTSIQYTSGDGEQDAWHYYEDADYVYTNSSTAALTFSFTGKHFPVLSLWEGMMN